MLTVLGGLAGFERELIRAHGRRPQARQEAGRPNGATAEAHGALKATCSKLLPTARRRRPILPAVSM
jgi:hypothetical protein